MTFFVGISGPKRVGKDTFAQHLSSRLIHRKNVIIDRIADPLYKWAENITGLTIAELMGPEKDIVWTEETAPFKNLIGKSPRSLLLDLGNFTRDSYGEDFLVNSLKNKYSHKMFDWQKITKQPVIIVPDVRTECEAAAMDILIGLEREGCNFVGGRTESGIKESNFWKKVKMKTIENGNTWMACEYERIAEELLEEFENAS
jgi:hypothetical protein